MKTCPICDFEYEDIVDVCPRHDVQLVSKVHDPLIGATVRDRYIINEMLGRGAMGVVYKATQTTDGKEVAIKVLHTHLASDTESVKRFHHEARAASSLMHPNIVRLYDVGIIPGGQPYIAMELLPGITLSDHLKAQKVLSTSEALPIIRQVCEALAEAHSHGVLHRDIKPANIMLTNRFGQENFVVVLDFSIAKVIQRVSDVDSTTPGLIFGSPAYMSPERFMGRGGDFRSDIYSLGIIMFQMLAGRTPFKSSDLYTLMNEHVTTVPPTVKEVRPESDVPDDLEVAIARTLAKKPEDRYSNMKQLLTEIYEIYRHGAEKTMQRMQDAQHSAELSLAARSGDTLVEPVAVTEIAAGKSKSSQDSGMQPLIFSTTAGSTTPDISTAALQHTSPAKQQGPLSKQQASSSKHPHPPAPADVSSTFDIHAGSRTPTTSLPVYSPVSSHQKKANIDENQLVELQGSGRWKNPSLAKSVDRRPAIRPNEPTGRIPFEFIALLVVIMCGVTAIWATQMPSETTRRAEQLIRAGNLEGAGGALQSWRLSGVREADQERFSELCMTLGRAYMGKQNYIAGAIYFELVPEKSRQFSEARTLARKCRKAFVF